MFDLLFDAHQPHDMQWLLAVAIFLIGSSIGSFLNVVIIRIPHGESVAFPSSHCRSCKQRIKWYDNIPLLSFLLLKGRCRFCKAKISWRYWLIELIVAVAFLSLFLKYHISWLSFKYATLIVLLVALAFIDLDTFLLPFPLLIMLIGSGLFFAYKLNDWTFAVWASVLGFLLFACVLVIFTWIFRKQGRLTSEQTAMGWGDPFLLAGIGAYVGMFFLPYVILLAAIQGIIAYVICFKISSTPRSDAPEDIPSAAIPFGPFLALAALEVAILQIVRS